MNISSNYLDGARLDANELQQRLEMGELVMFNQCPFQLPSAADLEFLRRQKVHNAKSISYLPDEKKLHGFLSEQAEDSERLLRILSQFSVAATNWLSKTLPTYNTGMRMGPLRFRVEEEKDRKNIEPRYSGSVLHIDMNGDAPTHGESFLRIFVNINLEKPRYWITSDSLEKLLIKWGDRVRVPHEQLFGFIDDFRLSLSGLLGIKPLSDSAYHRFMSRIHFYGKTDDYLQNQANQISWIFPPGSAWLVFSDLTSHAVQGGQFAIDQTYFVSSVAFKNPERSTKSLIKRFWAGNFETKVTSD
jgi:hypothetical protein